ncbi:hypothetical protein J2801_002145 [Paraburkholderia phenoliruptrix]|uniref:KilA-N domain-containing protein n=1 Tax=Paraburkholderia phenoliruptrix TaxID=252970 RepID=UPI00286243AC|nr:KilA-N domain-containing protein [Paraburkholderia phenoliruptrix]MDR6419894.1 hypothetical protein [Paraburkholderia phenoliruptrix]
MEKKNARSKKAESSAVEQREFTPKTGERSRPPAVIATDYNGIAVSFTGDGWFNATAAAARFGKRPVDWLRLPETKRYIAALADARGISEKTALISAKRNSGTWMHPKLAVRFAQWLDVDFAVWCDEQIDHILRGGLSVWQKDGATRSDTPDREPVLTVAAAMAARHRLPFGPIYEALNLFAGVACARDMTCGQVVAAAEFGARLLAGNATATDFEQINRNRALLGIASTQLDLLGGV